MSRAIGKHKKMKCSKCGKIINEGYRRISSRCKPCQLKFRRAKLKRMIEKELK